jgi:hypothetical protein
MIRAALSKVRSTPACNAGSTASEAMPDHLSAGLPRTLLTVVSVPVVAVAVGMHYSPELRSQVNRLVPGASDALSKLTHADYSSSKTPDPSADHVRSAKMKPHNEYESLPELLTRVTESKVRDPIKTPELENAGKKTEISSSKGDVTNSNDVARAGAGSLPDALNESMGTDVLQAGTTVTVDQLQRYDSNALSSTKPLESAREAHGTSVVEQQLGKCPVLSSKPSASSSSHGIARDEYDVPTQNKTTARSLPDASRSSGHVVDDHRLTDESVNSTSTLSGSGGSERLARVFGRGEVDHDTGPERDVVDSSVYKRPSGATWWSGTSKRDLILTNADDSDILTPISGPMEKEIAALKAELESQAKWDAVRLQEAVRAQSVADKKSALAEAARTAKQHKAELESCRENAIAEAQRLIEAKSAQLETDMIKRRDEEIAKLCAVQEKNLRDSLEAEFLDLEGVKAESRQREIIGLKAAVAALHDDLDQSREFLKTSQQASSLSAAAFSLCDIVHQSVPLTMHLETFSRSHDLGKLVSASIPEEFALNGVPTTNDLQSSFLTVSREGRKAALVPKERVGSIWGHMLASIVSHLKVAVDLGSYSSSSVEPKTDEERVRMAESLVANGDLAGAVIVLESLGPLPSEIVHDWVTLAKARIAAELGARTLMADAIVTQHSFAGCGTSSL